MSLDLTDAVAALLRPQENATLVLETSVPYSPESPTPVANTMRDTRRVLAIVTHIDGGEEQGGQVIETQCTNLPGIILTKMMFGRCRLFVMKWKRSSPPSLLLVGTMPMSADLELQATQLSNVPLPGEEPDVNLGARSGRIHQFV